MPRNPEHRGVTKEEFERFQRERPILLRSVATQLECWRHLCASPASPPTRPGARPSGGSLRTKDGSR